MTPSDPAADPVADPVHERARNFRDAFGGSALDTYRGIPVFAAPGLHELAAGRLAAAVPPGPAVRVLELGAGGGALSLRLAELGYAVTASDLFEERFAPRGTIPFRTLDLNGPFAGRIDGGFDAIVALELIEHLENPHHVLRQCAALLAPGGHLLVSTPNLANPVSQAMFVRDGVFQWYRDVDYREQGHIAPIAPVTLGRCAREAGFVPVWEGSVSDPYRRVDTRLPRATRWLARLLARVSGTPRHLQGEVYLALLRMPG